MSHIFLSTQLEGVATWWRIYRRDGVTLGFTTHDRDLTFGGILHRAAPGMIPSAIRRTSSIGDDSADIEGPLSHDTIAESDLAAGRFDGAHIEIGAVDWETLHVLSLYSGRIGEVSHQDGRFSATLQSAKTLLDRHIAPQTSPTCRADFCAPGCDMSPARFTVEAELEALDTGQMTASFTGLNHTAYAGGTLRWIDGPMAGQELALLGADAAMVLLGEPIGAIVEPGTRAWLREGCDKRMATCASRFGNAVNFRGEPFLPGNDLLARYPGPQ